MWTVSGVKNEPRSFMVHLTLGILRDLQVFFWLQVFSAPKQSPRPPTRRSRKPFGVEEKLFDE
jgi:hypothetical protein